MATADTPLAYNLELPAIVALELRSSLHRWECFSRRLRLVHRAC